MCDHPVVKFIGKQETPQKNKTIDLYQCMICGSTIVLENGKKDKVVLSKEKL